MGLLAAVTCEEKQTADDASACRLAGKPTWPPLNSSGNLRERSGGDDRCLWWLSAESREALLKR